MEGEWFRRNLRRFHRRSANRIPKLYELKTRDAKPGNPHVRTYPPKQTWDAMGVSCSGCVDRRQADRAR